jgi:hypothetical protein
VRTRTGASLEYILLLEICQKSGFLLNNFKLLTLNFELKVGGGASGLES